MTSELAETASATADKFLTTEEIDALDFSGLAPAEHLDDEDVVSEEGFWHAFDGERLYWQSWEPEDGPTRGIVSLMHGYAEHSSRYDHVAGALCRAGYAVMAMDARGHGRSTGKRGYVDDFDDYVLDFDLLKLHTADRWPGLPHFCLGHSNGGLIVLRYALREPERVTGYVVTSPMCGMAVEVPAYKSILAGVASKMWPSLSLPSGVRAEDISHIDRVCEKYADDPLVFPTATARWFVSARKAMADTFERADELQAPVLMLIAGSDELVDPRASEDVFHRMGGSDREMELYPELFHEILNEESWDDIMRRILDWMEKERGRE